jgi:hypothetical protein
MTIKKRYLPEALIDVGLNKYSAGELTTGCRDAKFDEA